MLPTGPQLLELRSRLRLLRYPVVLYITLNTIIAVLLHLSVLLLPTLILSIPVLTTLQSWTSSSVRSLLKLIKSMKVEIN